MNDFQTGEGARIRAGMEERSAKGFLIAQPKLGYQIERTECGTLSKIDSELVWALQQGFELASKGISLRKVTEWLRGHGVKGRRGGPVSLATVQRMLTDPFYAGQTHRDGQWLIGTHEPLVEQKLFSAVQRQLARRRYR